MYLKTLFGSSLNIHWYLGLLFFTRKIRNIWPCNLIRPCLNTEYKWAHVSQYIETQRPWDCRIIWLQYYRAIIIWHPRRMEPFWPQTLRTMETFWPWDHTLYGSMCQEPKKYKVSTSGLCQGETFVAFHTFYHLIWHLFKWKFPIFFFFLFLFQRLNSFEKKSWKTHKSTPNILVFILFIIF